MGSKNKKGQFSQLQENYACCTLKCCSSEHTLTLNTALTQQRPEEEILAWISRHCHAPGRSRDTLGRSVLHIAASLGKTDICNWLLTYKGASLNGKDKESGYTALHRAILYGQLRTAISFLKLGANHALTDCNGLTALDLILLDKPSHLIYSKSAPLEAYVWGSNSNYNLGTGDNSARNNPDLLEFFRKQNISIKKVALQKFHAGFLSSTGTVYTCGHGRGGRLGNRSEMSLLAPKPVEIRECIDIALGVDHSVFLVQSGAVYTCGQNTYHQLGQHPPPSRLLAPAPVQGNANRKAAKGVAAARYHSVFWTDDSLYTWGLNAGQLGHMKGEKSMILPKQVTSFENKDIKISQVAVSDGATVLSTNKGDVVAFHGYTSKKIGAKQHGIEKIEVTGGHLDPAVYSGDSTEIDFRLVAGGGSPLSIFILRHGQVLMWTEGKDKNFLTCILSVSKPQPFITELSVFRNGLMVVSKEGEMWQGTVSQFPAKIVSLPGAQRPTLPSSQNRFVPTKKNAMGGPSVNMKVKRVPGIHRAVLATSDPKGKNFCVLQVSPSESLTELPDVQKSNMIKDFTDFYNQMSEEDGIHDVVCVVQGVRFPAHSAILAAGSEYLGQKLNYMEDESFPVVLEINNIHPLIFKQLLEYMYTKSCSLLQEGPSAIDINPSNEKDKNGDEEMIEISENKKVCEVTLEVDGDPATVSAYAVHQKNMKKKAKDLTKNDKNVGNEKNKNALLLLQEAGKQLGVYGITKLIDCFRYSEGNVYQRTKPPKPKLDFILSNLEDLADVTLVAEDGVELFAHKSILVARSEYFGAMLTSSWMESNQGENHLNLMIKSCYLEAILEYLYRDQSRALAKSEDTEFISNLLVHADQLLLVRLKEQCENELSRLITLRNVAEMLDFTFMYMAEELKKSCLQFVVLNLGCLLESQALDKLDDEILTALDQYYRENNATVAARKISPIQGYPTADDIEHEYDLNPMTLDELIEYEDMVLSKGRPRNRRHSSGEKRKSPNPRSRNSSMRLSGGSGSEEEDSFSQDISKDMDRLSLIDFDIEEKDEEKSPDIKSQGEKDETKEENPVLDSRTSYFSNLLASASGGSILQQNLVETADLSEQVSKKVTPKSKKFSKLSQKEKKRLEEEKQVKQTAPASPVTPSWTGWSPTSTTSQPSLMDIMASQSGKEKQGNAKPTPQKDNQLSDGKGMTTPASSRPEGKGLSPTGSKSRRLSEGESGSKPSKRTSWKQLNLAGGLEGSPLKSPLSPGQSAANPWKTNRASISPEVSLSSSDEANTSFQQIMKQDAQEEKALNETINKPLHLLQLEEQALIELHQLYSLQYPGETITVARVQSTVTAKPVWKYKT